jgi:hypothetical protein
VAFTILILGAGIVIALNVSRHAWAYQQGLLDNNSLARSILLDILGLLLAIAIASYLGEIAGTYAIAKAGLWAGLAAGVVIGFLSAFGVRSLWEILMRALRV